MDARRYGIYLGVFTQIHVVILFIILNKVSHSINHTVAAFFEITLNRELEARTHLRSSFSQRVGICSNNCRSSCGGISSNCLFSFAMKELSRAMSFFVFFRVTVLFVVNKFFHFCNVKRNKSFCHFSW